MLILFKKLSKPFLNILKRKECIDLAKIYGYARCSTNEDRQDVNRQKRELKKMGATDETIYFEYASGRKDDRIEFTKMMSVVQGGDTICATEVSRLTRSTSMLCGIIEVVKEKKLRLIVQGGLTIDCRTGEIDVFTEGMLKMWGVFAEIESNLISERVKSGMANAKAKGIHVGRSETTIDDIPHVFLKHYPKLSAKQINVTEMARLCDLSRNSVYKYRKIIERQNE